MRTVIIGKNGTCKTTLLRCIAIGLSGEADANAFLAEPNGQLISEESKTGNILIELASRDTARKPIIVSTELERRHDHEIIKSQEPSLPRKEPLFLCGYGAGRSTEGPDSGRPFRIVDSAYTLFNYEQTLIIPELMLRRLKDYLGTTIYANTMRGIKRVLGLSPSDSIVLPKGGGVYVKGPSIGKRIPIDGWADGYRKTFNWILDLYGFALRAKAVTRSGGISGILLIDELEQHLHPSMQTQLLHTLSKLIPETQLFVTTHSPLVTLGASPEDVTVLYRKRRRVFAEQQVPDFTGYSAEDMLQDKDLFATDVYSREVSTKLEEYRKLAKEPTSKLKPMKRKRLKKLAKELDAQQLIPVVDTPLIREIKRLRNKFSL